MMLGGVLCEMDGVPLECKECEDMGIPMYCSEVCAKYRGIKKEDLKYRVCNHKSDDGTHS